MKPRLSRPLLTIAVSGALIAAGGLAAGPAAADPGVSYPGPQGDAPLLGDPGTPDPGTPDPGTPDPGTPDPGTPDPGTPDPGTPDPGTPDPGTPTVPDPGTPTVPGPPVVPDPTDTTAPVGTFKLNTAALWIGQSVTLTQGAVTDETSTPDQISRVAAWGDGTSSVLTADTAAYPHRYSKNGKFTVTVTYQDAAGNSSNATSAVTITTPGKFAFSKTSVWRHQAIKATFSKVPNGTTKIMFDQGDGYVVTLKGKNQASWFYYDTRKSSGAAIKGLVRPKATFYNKYGATSAITMGRITVKVDSWRPTVKITKPGNSNRIKSWNYAKGTAADKGSGLYRVAVFGTRINGSQVYCYSAANTWKRVTTESQANRYCVAHYVKVSKGKWSLRLKGVAKGTLYVDASAQDNAGSWGKFATVKAKITRK